MCAVDSDQNSGRLYETGVHALVLYCRTLLSYFTVAKVWPAWKGQPFSAAVSRQSLALVPLAAGRGRQHPLAAPTPVPKFSAAALSFPHHDPGRRLRCAACAGCKIQGAGGKPNAPAHILPWTPPDLLRQRAPTLRTILIFAPCCCARLQSTTW